ncbi:MAG: contractile injection system tape measure protein, partial [Ferruginibacter sp.]
MIRQNHTIKKFSLELQTDGREQAYNLQRKCITMVNESLAKGMDEVLSNHFAADDMVRINKLEIDLGTISLAALETDFVARCIAELSNKINAIPVAAAQQETGEITIVDKEENAIGQFFYFLATGKMLWTVSDISFEQWQMTITAAIRNKAYLFKNEFSKLLVNEPPVMQRLLLQFDDDFIALLVELYQPGLKNEYVRLAALLQEQIFATDHAVARSRVLATLLPAIFLNLSVIKKDTLPQLIEWINNLPVKNDD